MGAAADELLDGEDKKKKSAREKLMEAVNGDMPNLTEEQKRQMMLKNRGTTLIGGARG